MHCKAGFEVSRTLPALFNPAVVSQHIGMAVDHPLHAAPGNSLKLIHFLRGGRHAVRNGLGHWMIRPRCEALGQPLQGLLAESCVHGLESHQLGLAFGDGAGLVQRHGLDLARLFQVHTTFDQDASPRPSGQTADDGDGRGNHQGARAGDDQQHQGLVGGLHPGQPHEPGRQQRNGNGQDEHRRRVDGGKAIHETLRGRTGRLGLLNGVDDPRQRAVGRGGRDTDFQRRSLIDGAGEDFIAGALVHRQAFAGHGGLVNSALT